MISGYLIKLLRISKGINQEAVSEKLGITQQAYSKIENKEYIDKATSQKILSALGGTYEDLEKLSMISPPQT